jgi:hypothetical protein
MLRIVWNPRGFHLIKVLGKGGKFNAGCYVAEILEPLSQWRSIEAGNERELLVQADSARPHTAQSSNQYFNENRMKSVPHPSYFPDLAVGLLFLRVSHEMSRSPLIRGYRSISCSSKRCSRGY